MFVVVDGAWSICNFAHFLLSSFGAFKMTSSMMVAVGTFFPLNSLIFQYGIVRSLF